VGHRGGFFSTFVLAILVVAGCFSAPARAEKRIALVIGNDRYANLPAERQLQKAANDAQAVGDALKLLGFQVIRGTNLSRQGMIDKLSELTGQLEPGDTAAFFYAGHGVAIGGVNYLVPSDVPAVTEGAETRVRGASVAEGDVMAEIQGKGVRVALLVLDACRDNPFPRSATRAIGNTRGLADAKPARGVFTIYSAGIGQTALDRLEPDDPNRNSVFTRVFIEQMTKPGLDLGGLAVEVRERVAELALKAKDDSGRPDPHEQTPAYYDQTVGGRVFLTARAIATEPPAPSAPNPMRIPQDEESERSRLEITFWNSIKNDKNPRLFEAYLNRYPTGNFAEIAKITLEELKTAALKAAVVQPDDKIAITDPGLFKEVRERLYELNFDPGPLEGPYTDAAHEAIREFEQKSNLAPTGTATMGLLRRLREIGGLKPWGAIVYAPGEEKWGMAWNNDSRNDAVASARSSCGSASKCTAEVSFFGTECGAFAHSGGVWAIVARDKIQRAKDAALADCSKRGKACRIVAVVCADGAERSSAAN
jgi:Caspase domain/Domain of unknown function (DUF4189)